MNFPLNLNFGVFEISSHLLFETLAFLIGFRFYMVLRKKEKALLTSSERLWILIAVSIGAILFSRFIAVMEHIELVNRDTPLLFYYSQKTIVGGLLGGLIAVEITKKFLGIKYSSGDIMTYPLILAIMIGRVGCFLAGLEDGTYGVETELVWGINFGDGVKRHPTQIYEIIFLMVLWIWIRLLESQKVISYLHQINGSIFQEQNRLPNGVRFKLFLFHYLIFRFIIEFIKPVNLFLFRLSFIQIACILGIGYYYFLLLRFYLRKYCL
ncbi:MAG: prolipoprotein diacylglyceryl transferase [Leptospiraceae bacterium]|nr:prolipoprotein diacylglyceryl transferase [Leptospiraceae bacterium]